MTENSVVGIVAEYNPFHNGHIYHLRKSKELTGAGLVIAVMSGNFTQRGEPAILDKWKRAEIAVKNGVDLVIELPFLYACNSAEYFAEGAVKLLHALEIVDFISFGAEQGDISKLDRIAEILAHESAEFRKSFKEHADSGISFPAARQKALEDIAGNESSGMLKSPNNILAIEYMKQLKRSGSRIKPVVIQRSGAGYEEINPVTKIAGASALRKLIFNGEVDEALGYMPEQNLEDNFARLDNFYTLAVYAVRTKPMSDLSGIQSASEGLENKLKKALDSAFDMRSLLAAVKSKRYTQTRIQRFIIQTIFGITKDVYFSLNSPNNLYIRILGINQDGAKLLKRIKGTANIPVISNLGKREFRIKESSIQEIGSQIYESHKSGSQVSGSQESESQVSGSQESGSQVSGCQESGSQEFGGGSVAELLELDILASDIYNLANNRDAIAESDFRKRPFVIQ
jgi:predicted nucleotidyltransferase